MSNALQVGTVTVQRIVEQEGPFFGVMAFFPALTKEVYDENRSWLQPRYVDKDNKLNLCIQSYLLRTPQHTILVDTCVGNHKPRPTRPFWHEMTSDRYERNLAAAGVSVDDIDFVMCTHLHTDHVGWNTRLENGRWVPTFPKARYVFSDRELDHWTERHTKDPSAYPWITDSVLPIVAANRADIVKNDFEFNDIIHLTPSPGHTFDHYSLLLGKTGKDAIVTGDMVHSPLQMRYPEYGMMSDWDSPTAGRSRRRLFEQFCDTSTLWCTAHFPSPSLGRVTRWGDGFRFVEASE
jgi:glyoxylase-like metal-dependent hydrolase (beta-lactamase superfamily II)